MESDINKWYDKLFIEEDTRYISVMIGYQMSNNWGGTMFFDINSETLLDICDFDYLTLKKDIA